VIKKKFITMHGLMNVKWKNMSHACASHMSVTKLVHLRKS